MSLYALSTKSVKGLHVECKSLGLKNYRQKKKSDLIDYIHLKRCFQAISTFENDEYDILKLYFARLKLFAQCRTDARTEMSVIQDQEQNQVRLEGLSEGLLLTNPRPSNDSIESFIETLRNKYCNPDNEGILNAELDFEPYENERYNHYYSLHKQCLLDDYGEIGVYDERILIHGTDEESISSILKIDFALTKDKRHGSAFGRGIYFTDDLSLACKYSEKGKRDKYFIICQVHIGNIVLGKHNMDMLPKMEGQDRLYDTAVNHLLRPKQFVKFKNHTYNFLGILHLKILNPKSSLLIHDRRSSQNLKNRVVTNRGSYRISQPGQPNNLNNPNNLVRMNSSINQSLRHGITLINETKMTIHIYLVKNDIMEGKLKILSDKLRKFLNLHQDDLITEELCWDRIRTYCETNKLQTSDKKIFMPDQELISLLNISPTTRISNQNIQKLLEPHYISLNKDNMSYITSHSKLMEIIDPGKEKRFRTYKDPHFICGFFTDKKPHPYNFIVVDDFIVDKSEVRKLSL